jgi:hypothetical protein
MEPLPASPAATSTAHPTEPSHGASAAPTGELGDFFLVRKQETYPYLPFPIELTTVVSFFRNLISSVDRVKNRRFLSFFLAAEFLERHWRLRRTAGRHQFQLRLAAAGAREGQRCHGHQQQPIPM